MRPRFGCHQRGERRLARELGKEDLAVEVLPGPAAAVVGQGRSIEALAWQTTHGLDGVDDVLAAFEGLVGECRRFGARWPAAWFTRQWVEALLARGDTGDREQALSPLRQAAAELDAIGAPIYAKQAERRMNELARR